MTQVTLVISRGSQGESQVVASECEYKETKLGCREQCVVVDPLHGVLVGGLARPGGLLHHHRLHPGVLTSRPPVLNSDIHAMFDGIKIEYCILSIASFIIETTRINIIQQLSILKPS